MTQLFEVDGIGEAYAAKLVEAGIETMGELLNHGATPEGREDLSEQTGISPKRILKWVNGVDHFSVLGIREEYGALLESCGVDTVKKLAEQDALDLFECLVEGNKGRKFIKRLPSPRQVEDWIKAARKLPDVMGT
jgi:hypothetical protein